MANQDLAEFVDVHDVGCCHAVFSDVSGEADPVLQAKEPGRLLTKWLRACGLRGVGKGSMSQTAGAQGRCVLRFACPRRCCPQL